MAYRFTLVTTVLLTAVAPANAQSRTAARADAEAWLAIIDAGKYAESWTHCSSVFQSRVSREKWEAEAGRTRVNVGPLSSRKFLRVSVITSPPRVPPGTYAIVEFQSSFRNKNSIGERVTLVFQDGRWRVAGYYLV